MPEFIVRSTDPGSTSRIGERLASHITGPVSIALNGTLGSGKTYLAKSIISGLGVELDSISSPTFTICQEHAGHDWSIFHVDLYRVVDDDELLELGIEQWLDGDGIAIIEWADRFRQVSESCDLQIDLRIIDENCRDLRIRMPENSGRFPNINASDFV